MSHKEQVASKSRWPRALRFSQLFADPLRIRILTECNSREISPKLFHEQIGGGTLPKITHAFDLLAQYEWIEPTQSPSEDVDPTERLYRGLELPVIRDEDMSAFPTSVRAVIVARIFESFVAQTKEAMNAGTIWARSDGHVTWHVLELDRQGWATMIARLEAIFGSVEEEQEAASARMEESGEEPISMTVGLFGFESPADEAPKI